MTTRGASAAVTTREAESRIKRLLLVGMLASFTAFFGITVATADLIGSADPGVVGPSSQPQVQTTSQSPNQVVRQRTVKPKTHLKTRSS